MRLPLASPVWQHAATLEPQACWMGMATGSFVRWGKTEDGGYMRTDGDAQAVGTDEVLAAVAAGELLAIPTHGLVGLGVDVDVGVAVRCTTGWSGVREGSHGGDEESLEESHFVGWIDRLKVLKGL
jgi:hypothetical protein